MKRESVSFALDRKRHRETIYIDPILVFPLIEIPSRITNGASSSDIRTYTLFNVRLGFLYL